MKVAVAGAPLARDAIEALGLARQVLGHRSVQGKVGVRGPGPRLEQKSEGAVERAAGPLDPGKRALEALFGIPGAAQLLAAAEGCGPGATGRVSRAAQLHGPHRPGVDRPPERIVGRIGGGEHHRAQARRVADRVRLGQQSPVRVAVERDRTHAECAANGLDVGRGFRGREPLIARPELVRTRGGRDHLRDHPPLQLRAIDRLGVARAALVDQHQVAATQKRPEHRPVRLRRVEAGAGVPGSALDGEDRSEGRSLGLIPRADCKEDRLVSEARLTPHRRHGDSAAAESGPGADVARADQGRVTRRSDFGACTHCRGRSVSAQEQHSQDRGENERQSQSRHERSLDLQDRVYDQGRSARPDSSAG